MQDKNFPAWLKNLNPWVLLLLRIVALPFEVFCRTMTEIVWGNFDERQRRQKR